MKIVALSDTHSKHRLIEEVPDGDVLVHAGDMTETGDLREVEDFAEWFSSFNHEYKMVVAGNHDFVFDGIEDAERQDAINALKEEDIIYLENDTIMLDGIRFYGTPYSKSFDKYVFTDEFGKIPETVDVLITHGPPKGKLDNTKGWGRIGCKDLRQAVNNVEPSVHIFGHAHYCDGEDGLGSYNVSILDEDYNIDNNPTVITNVNTGDKNGD